MPWKRGTVLFATAVLLLSGFSASGQSTQDQITLLKGQVTSQQKQIELLRRELEEQREMLERALQALPASPAAAKSGSSPSPAPVSWSAGTSPAESGPGVAQAPAPQKPLTTAELVAGGGFDRIRFKNIFLAAGGFVEATAIWRSHNMNADLGSTFGNIPLAGTANSRLSEFRGSARQSRLALYAEGEAKGVKAFGYFETDFLGAAPTANELDSNSFQPRLRQFWGSVDLPRGFSLTAGQMWSLLTSNRTGLRPRSELFPLNVDAQYLVGFTWARQNAFRLTKSFGKKFYAAFSVENPETGVGGVVLPAGVLGLNGSPNTQSPSSQFTTSITPGANGISTDPAPDILAKVVWEPGWGHWELKALGRAFRDRLNGKNNTAQGGGLGVGAIFPARPNFDLIFEGLAGAGIGRYGSAIGPDIVVRPDGAIVPVRGAHLRTGWEWHPTPAWDVYAYYGLEYYARTAYAGSAVGYGSPLADLAGCTSEVPGTCPGANQTIWEINPGIWYRFYKGKEGIVALGLSYGFMQRQLWSGLGGIRPKGQENTVMTSVRYYLP